MGDLSDVEGIRRWAVRTRESAGALDRESPTLVWLAHVETLLDALDVEREIAAGNLAAAKAQIMESKRLLDSGAELLVQCQKRLAHVLRFADLWAVRGATEHAKKGDRGRVWSRRLAQ